MGVAAEPEQVKAGGDAGANEAVWRAGAHLVAGGHGADSPDDGGADEVDGGAAGEGVGAGGHDVALGDVGGWVGGPGEEGVDEEGQCSEEEDGG